MASEVDICNMALSHCGDIANVQSIVPPDGTAQSDHCAKWYPVARDSLLEEHDWAFATKRTTLALLSNVTSTSWAYGYAAPADMLNPIAMLDQYASDDYTVGIASGYLNTDQINGTVPYTIVERGMATPQPFAEETAQDGTCVLWTNLVNAQLRYIFRQTDPTRFSNLFVETLGWKLAALLAGPLVKGQKGVQLAAYCEKAAKEALARAATSDSGQKKTTARERQPVAWINGR